MKVTKQKRHRRIVRFYSACFGFREPFKILCDGTFIHHLITNKITPVGQALSNILGGSTKLFTTRCIIAELKSVIGAHSDSFREASSLITARCDHEKRIPGVECIEEVIGKDNSEHFFVATQDSDLQKKFQKVACVPVVYGLRNSLFLSRLTKSQRELAEKNEEERLRMELKLLEKMGNKESAAEVTSDAGDTDDGLDDRAILQQSLTNRRSTRRSMGVVDKARFKRKIAKGPNPLSCKKKKTPGNPSSVLNQVSWFCYLS
ncbi:hypothetical protein AQUCO_02300061v1 [Aquilegia coerulea]|uniref:UTP23 sensor motif region domain-containing protein n=1 Tax=Aquilegia coerulea TaxID=218851 RepID=A0A2G5DBX4_AQUCA|nr:hypothetical protein AQUCO_02300061v1 [Aquilegia coerulea]